MISVSAKNIIRWPKRVTAPYVVLAVGLLFTLLTSWYVWSTSATRDRLQFENNVELTESSIKTRIETYTSVLRSGAALFGATASVNRAIFRNFARRLEIQQRYPGLQGVGFSAVVEPGERDALTESMRAQGFRGFTITPDNSREVYHPILYLEPNDRLNQEAIGYDMFTDPVRRDAMERARDSNEPAASGRVALNQESDELKRYGFLIYVPVYKQGTTSNTVGERRTNLVGFVFSPFRSTDLFTAILGSEGRRNLNLQVFDGEPVSENLLYPSVPAANGGRPYFVETAKITIAGRPWTLVFTSRPEFESGSGRYLLPLSLVIGVLVSLVLFGVTKSQANARAIAERTAKNLMESRRALSENEVRVRRLIDANIIGVVIADSSGHVIEANDAFLEIVGRNREDLESGDIVWTERSPPESSNNESDALAETHLQRRHPAFEHEYVREDGTRVPVLIGSAYLGGADELAVAFILDLTERKQAEAAVREADQRAISEYERLLERLTGLAQAFGSARDLLSIYRALLGFAMASVPCDGVFISLYDEWREHCEAAYAWGDGEEIDVSVLEPIPVSGDGPSSRAVKTGQIVVTDDYMQTPEGHSMVIVGADDGLHPESSLVAPLSVMGRIVGTMEVQSYKPAAYTNEHVVSIRMAANLAAVAIENVQLLERESRARNQAEESNRMKDEFLATVSHELRTPLTAILGWSRMLMMGGFDEATIADAIETIERNATSQARLIDDILEVSRVVTGKLQLEVEPVELKTVVTAAVNSVRPAAEAKGINLSVRQPDAEDVVSGDPNRLQQVVWNLLSNGVKFTPEGGSIEVDLHRQASEVVLTVRDTGYGISAGFLPYVFDRFRQADSSITRTHGGLGLGLAIVRHLVELHGGSVSAESPGEDMGAAFTVRLPLLRVSSQKSSPKESNSGETRLLHGSRSLRGLRVMVVDDEMDTADMVEAVLARYGAVVSKANSVDEAMVELTRFVPDVIVSDIGMPGRDGYELIRMIRAGETGRGKRIPAIALTAYVRENDRAMALGAGFQEHLPKPVDPRKLLATIASLAGA